MSRLVARLRQRAANCLCKILAASILSIPMPDEVLRHSSPVPHHVLVKLRVIPIAVKQAALLEVLEKLGDAMHA
mgnify:CR=1 FL=1